LTEWAVAVQKPQPGQYSETRAGQKKIFIKHSGKSTTKTMKEYAGKKSVMRVPGKERGKKISPGNCRLIKGVGWENLKTTKKPYRTGGKII